MATTPPTSANGTWAAFTKRANGPPALSPILVCTENFAWLLFNLNEDPYEEANQAQNNEYRAERKRLLAHLRQWIADTGDKFTLPET
ncbi:MAG: hypothetical protein ACJ73N_01230 [Bryobacteraceae bacterium]